MNSELKAAVENAMGIRVRGIRAVSGGDINQSFRITTAQGQDFFLKTHPNPPAHFYAREAEGLAWLAEVQALRVPRCIFQCGVRSDAPAMLVLEHLDSAPPSPGHDELLGRGLAQIHSRVEEQFGYVHTNYIGHLPQSNGQRKTWAEFYGEQRLLPQFQMAARAGLMPSGLRKEFETLLARLESLCGPDEPPSRVHGDLWSGNTITDEKGAPCLIDPAVYAGHREVDLAMMQLFGGFGHRVFSAYQEVYPTAPGFRERIPLHQLYYLLVHLNLFGPTYLASVRRAVQEYL